MTGRTPGSVKTPGSGRKKGSLDLAERRLLTGQMAADLMTVYRKLGGVRWLEKFARDNPGEFLRQGLSRLFPAPQRDDPDVLIQQQFNYGNGDLDSDMEVTRRLAYVLNKGAIELKQRQQEPQPIESTPVKEPELPSLDSVKITMADTPKAPFIEDAERVEYFRQQQLSDEEKLTLDTREKTLFGQDCYRGSDPAEQGRVYKPAPARTKRETIREKNRRKLL